MLGYDAGASGSPVGEYDGAGNLIQETVWLGDIPVATIRPSGSSIAIYYVVTDHLDTPREIVRPSDNAVMWSWFTGPFGVEAPNTNPQGAGTFAYDLRLPGQIAGAWGSTYQNYQRDFDPAVGRYIESDPVGLAGDSYSTYAYAKENPLSNKDKNGESPWDDMSGGVTPEEAQALSIEQEFNYWFNTPNPCVKQQLERDHLHLADFISEFSALNLTQGFWNTAPGGAAGAWASEGAGAATKIGIVQWLNHVSEGLGENAARALEWLLPPVVAYSTYQHVKAADESIKNCGCSQ